MLDGRLSLTTPEGVRLLLVPAGPAVRAWAWALDFVLWLAAAVLVITLLSDSRFGKGVISLWLFASYWGYPILCEVYWGGRTLGKRAAGIEVLRADGLPVGWRESGLRNLLLVADFLPVFYATGLVCMLCDSQFRRVGDIVAGTQVVYRDKYRNKPRQQAGGPAAQPLPLPFPLSVGQQRALIDLFEREALLPPERLQELGTLAAPLTGLTGAESVERLRGFASGLTR